MSSQNELVAAEVRKEQYRARAPPRGGAAGTGGELHRKRGVDADLAYQVAGQVSAHPEEALGVHVREELGVDYEELPSPLTAAGAPRW